MEDKIQELKSFIICNTQSIKEINSLINEFAQCAKENLDNHEITFTDHERHVLNEAFENYNADTVNAALQGNAEALYRLLLAHQTLTSFLFVTTPQYAYWRPISVKADKSTAGKASAAAKAAWHSEGKAQAIAIRKVNPTLTQSELADKIIAHWNDKKVKAHCGREQLIKLIRGWENDEENPLPKAKRC
jgi:hypothetical protein